VIAIRSLPQYFEEEVDFRGGEVSFNHDYAKLPSFIDPCLDTGTPLFVACLGTPPCHPRMKCLAGRGYPAKTIGITSLSSWLPGVPGRRLGRIFQCNLASNILLFHLFAEPAAFTTLLRSEGI
jgi:hypothetical protein